MAEIKETTVILPSGAGFTVYDADGEFRYAQERVAAYKRDFILGVDADLGALDQLVVFEILMNRWGSWVAREENVFGEPVNPGVYNKMLNDASGEARQLRKSLNIDKASRDKQKGADDIAEYMDNLRRRAKEFGVHREEQLDKALGLFSELKAKLQLHENATAAEAKELNATVDDIFEWLNEVAIPAYDKIDDHFRNREDGQKYWISTT